MNQPAVVTQGLTKKEMAKLVYYVTAIILLLFLIAATGFSLIQSNSKPKLVRLEKIVTIDGKSKNGPDGRGTHTGIKINPGEKVRIENIGGSMFDYDIPIIVGSGQSFYNVGDDEWAEYRYEGSFGAVYTILRKGNGDDVVVDWFRGTKVKKLTNPLDEALEFIIHINTLKRYRDRNTGKLEGDGYRWLRGSLQFRVTVFAEKNQ